MNDEPVGCLGFLFRLFGLGTGPRSNLVLPKVIVSKRFVTNAEADFFRVLQRVVSNRGHILAQVSLGQLLWFPGNEQTNPGRIIWQNKTRAKSVDFVICDPATLRPKLAIELDDSSHATPRRQTRDDEVELILKAAGLPLIHVLTSRMYDTRELTAAIAPYLNL